MNFAIDRLNAILKHYGGTPLTMKDVYQVRREHGWGSNPKGMHEAIDSLDRQAGITTHNGRRFSHPMTPVGARLALHEQHIEARKDRVVKIALPYTAKGKEVLRKNRHYADACSETAAMALAKAMNVVWLSGNPELF